MITEKGQSLVEVIFSVGVMVLVITGVVSLIVKTTSLKTLAGQRKKASEMTEVIIENQLSRKKTDPDNFWILNDITSGQTLTGYDGYTYTIDFELVTGSGCSTTVNECANANITVNWGDNQNLTVKRFFSKKI